MSIFRPFCRLLDDSSPHIHIKRTLTLNSTTPFWL